MSDHGIPQLLGKIDGKLDQVIKTMDRHIDDDVRRFTEVYKTLGEHDKQIAEVKGAKKLAVWLLGGGGVAIGAAVAYVAKAFGG